MSFLVIMGIVFGGLFLAAFLTKRRLGLLGLALGAGSILASLWANDLTPIVVSAGIEIVKPPMSSILATILILLPPILLFFNGASVKETLLRVAHSAVFAALAVALLIEPLGAALVIDSTAKPIYEFLVHYNTIFITAGLVLSVADLMFGKPKRREKESRH